MDIVTSLLNSDKHEQPKMQMENGIKVIELEGKVDKKFYNKFMELYAKCQWNEELIIELTTEGGELIFGYMIAKILQNHKGNLTLRIPKYALSAGTIITLACQNVVMSHAACIGPIDPYIAGLNVHESSRALENYNQSWFKYVTRVFSSKFFNLITEYGGIMLNKIKNDHQDKIMRLLSRHSKPEVIYNFFTNEHHHQTPIYFTDIPAELNLGITSEPELLTIIHNRKNPIPQPTRVPNFMNMVGQVATAMNTSEGQADLMNMIMGAGRRPQPRPAATAIPMASRPSLTPPLPVRPPGPMNDNDDSESSAEMPPVALEMTVSPTSVTSSAVVPPVIVPAPTPAQIAPVPILRRQQSVSEEPDDNVMLASFSVRK